MAAYFLRVASTSLDLTDSNVAVVPAILLKSKSLRKEYGRRRKEVLVKLEKRENLTRNSTPSLSLI